MLINFSDANKLRTGISLANKGQFFDAICLFAQVESYESNVNRILCWCHMQKFTFVASDLYVKTKQRYPHCALFSDIRSYSPLTDKLLKVCEHEISIHDGTVKANPKLLIRHNLPTEEEKLPQFDFDNEDDVALFGDPRYSPKKFYDVNSIEYFTSLRVNLLKCYASGDENGVLTFGKRLMAVKTEHMRTLEAQINYVLQGELYEKGMPYARRLVKCKDATYNALVGAIEIVVRQEVVNPKVLSKLLYKTLEIPDLRPADLQDFTYFASEFVHDDALAYKFALQLKNCEFWHYLDILQLCACAFYNYGDLESARFAAYHAYRAAPDDAFCTALYNFVNAAEEGDRLHLAVPPRAMFYLDDNGRWQGYMNMDAVWGFFSNCSHYFVPKALLDRARFNLKVMLAGNSPQLSDSLIQDFSLLLRHVMYCSCCGPDDYSSSMQLISEVLKVPPQSKEKYVDLIKSQLMNPMGSLYLQSLFVAALLRCDCRDVIYVLLQRKYYLLDLSTLGHEEEFIDPISVCVTTVAVTNPTDYYQAFLRIKETLDLSQYDAFQIAFAMLCMCEKGFSKQHVYHAFTREMRRLYLDFCKKQPDNKFYTF